MCPRRCDTSAGRLSSYPSVLIPAHESTQSCSLMQPVPDRMDEEVSRLIREVRLIRKNTSMTQRQLATESGIAYQNISRMERQEAIPNLRQFVRYADALGYSVTLTKKDNKEDSN